MINMENSRLSEIYDFQYGKGNNNPDNGGIYPIYGSNGIIGGYDKFNSEDSPVIGHIGANCGVVVFGKGKHFVTYNGVICKIKKGVDPKFGYYVLLASNLRRLGFGSAQPFVSYGTLKRVAIYKPDLNIQEKLGKILNNYDQLIENNNKRIQLLESMAEELYKEWFVRFRFPGYKSVDTKKQSAKGWCFGDIEDGQFIPVDWNFSELIETAEFKRGKNITSSEMVDGEIPVIAAGLEPSGYHNDSNVKGYNLTVSASGANAGFLAYHLEDIWAADCSYYQNDDNVWFVYNALKFLQPVISNMQVGSAQPHVYAKNINRISTIKPSNEWVQKYEEKVNPIYEEIKNLKEKNVLLIKQRDALLPRLMSGKLSVEGKEVI